MPITWKCLKCGGEWSDEKIKEFKGCPHCRFSKDLRRCPDCGSIDMEEQKK